MSQTTPSLMMVSLKRMLVLQFLEGNGRREEIETAAIAAGVITGRLSLFRLFQAIHLIIWSPGDCLGQLKTFPVHNAPSVSRTSLRNHFHHLSCYQFQPGREPAPLHYTHLCATLSGSPLSRSALLPTPKILLDDWRATTPLVQVHPVPAPHRLNPMRKCAPAVGRGAH